MIKFNNVSKSYPNGHQALSQISLQLQPGEMAFLTGHSGAGKSTLLKLIAMIEPITSGQILVNNINLGRLPKRQIPHLRRDMGMIFQNPQLIPNRTIFENIAMPLIISGYRNQEIKRRVRAILEKVGLSNRENVFPIDLSSGEQQRVSIARAVINRPTILLADEPTGNLDPDLSYEIMRLFEAFNKVGTTLLIATHNVSLISPMNHRILRLEHGKLVTDLGGPPHE